MLVGQFKHIAKNITVLYVEDSKSTQLLVKELLASFFSNIQVCSNGQEGLDAYKENKHDLVITDVDMPVMNGVKMIQEIKKINLFQNVVVTSAIEDTKVFIGLINEGIDRFMVKPINSKFLLSVLAKVCFNIHTDKQRSVLENSLLEKNEEINTIFNYVDNAIFMIDDGELILANIQALELTEDPSQEGFEEMLLNLDEYLVEESGFLYAKNIDDLISKSLESEEFLSIKIKIGETTKVYSYSIHQMNKKNKYVFFLSDITNLSDAIYINPITELPNSLAIEEKVQHICSNKTSFCVICFSIENLSLVQQWHGRDSVTLAEKKIANILKNIVPTLEIKCFFANFAKNSFVFIVEKDNQNIIEFLISEQKDISSYKQNSDSKNQKINLKLKSKSLNYDKTDEETVMDDIYKTFEDLHL